MSRPKIRVAVLLDGLDVPAWVAAVIDDLAASQVVDACLAVYDAAAGQTRRQSGRSRSPRRAPARAIDRCVFWVHERFVEKPLRIEDPFRLANAGARLGDTQRVAAAFDVDARAETFAIENIESIAQARPDVLVNLTARRPRGKLLEIARYGVWGIDHGGATKRDRPAGFGESLRADPVTRVAVCRLASQCGDDRVLQQTFFATDARSARNNAARHGWKRPSLVAHALARLSALGPEAFFAAASALRPAAEAEQSATSAASLALAKQVAAKYARKRSRKKYKKRFYEQWRLLYAFDAADATVPLGDYQALVPPPDRFWADPFVVQKDGRYHLFIEDYPYATKRGHIAVITLDANGRHTDAHPVLSKPYHLSYPFVFARGNDYFMIPETRQNRSIELYRCVDFPKRWVFERTLMTGVAAVDVTPFEYDDKWWLFACIEDPCDGSTHDDLYLFYADDLLTDRWQAHPHNPIVSDCRQARPAGKVFFEGGRMYRISQDCSVRYGYGFNLVEITALTEQRYAETLISKITPEQQAGILGAHTFNKTGSLQVSDALYPREHCS